MDSLDYSTNAFVVRNVASVAYRFYEPTAEQAATFASTALPIETSLREHGHLSLYDAGRRGIWHFRTIVKDDSNDVAGSPFESPAELSQHALRITQEGSLDPASLQGGPSHTPGTNAAANGGSMRPAAPQDDMQQNSLSSRSQSLSQPSTSFEQDPRLSQPGAGEETDTLEMSNKSLYEAFIAATLQTILYTFCQESEALPLDYRTVLLSSHAADDGAVGSSNITDPVLGAFRVYLTTTGTLVVSMDLSCCHGLSLMDNIAASGTPSPAYSIIAAPFGALSHPLAHRAIDSSAASAAQTPTTHLVSLRGPPNISDSHWKLGCIQILEHRGIPASILAGCPWINLQISKRRLLDATTDAQRQLNSTALVSVPWPEPLCFYKKAAETYTTVQLRGAILSGHEECHDSLGRARSWFTSGEDRDEKLKKRRADRASAMLVKDSNGPESRMQRIPGQSPLAARRTSTTMPAGAMYPTPPDALQNFNGVTPSMDGTISSPGNPPSATAMVDMDTTVSAMDRPDEPMTGGDDGLDRKHDRSDSNPLGDADDMFEDMGGDMFGDDDITEADFNFFDEQPREAAADSMANDTSALSNNGAITKPITSLSLDRSQQAASYMPTPISQVTKDDGVFAKPELRHASSFREAHAPARTQDKALGAPKRDSSPFNPDTVFKRLRVSLSISDTASPVAAAMADKPSSSAFNKLEFDGTLPTINKKYEHGGIYDFNQVAGVEPGRPSSRSLPENDYLTTHGKLNKKTNELGFFAGTVLQSQAEQDGAPGLPLSDDDTSMESDQDESSPLTEDLGSPVKSSLKPTLADDETVSHAASNGDVDHVEEPDQHLALELPRLAKPERPEVPLSKLFADPESIHFDLSLDNNDLVQVAQIVAEQAGIGSLDICTTYAEKSTSVASAFKSRIGALEPAPTLSILEKIVSDYFAGMSSTRLKGLLDVQDVPLPGQATRQPSRLQPRPVPGRGSNQEQPRPSNLYQIPGPHLELRRSDTKLSVLSSAIQFWASLGLAPLSGGKDVSAVGVFPGWKGMAGNVSTFLERLKSVYESLKLGPFEKLCFAGDLEDGILPYEVDRISTSPDATMTGHGTALVETMETLLGAMLNMTATDTNVVIYFVYSPTNPSTIVEACIAFQRLFDSYQKALSAKGETAPNELVLQLVSTEILSSPDSMIITPSAELIKLCMQTYDRCTLFGGVMPAPAIKLEQTMPRTLEFKINAAPFASVMHENSCMHVAYAQSVDSRWVTAAWTDDQGTQQATAAYCLGRRGKPSSTTMNDVANEIWESTLQLISVWKVHWRVIVTKCAPMEQHEVDFWLDLARTEIKANVTVVLMTVDTSPSLQLIPPAVKIPQPATTAIYTTPVSTPQANTASPEQSATPATPMRETPHPVAATPTTTTAGDSPNDPDSDSVLVDITDQTWAALLGHKLSNSTSAVELDPCLASGYLIKRTGPRAEDRPVLMEVNLIHADAQPRAYEPLIRETLSHFRGLGTLARARGVTDWETDVRPWHVAVAEKAVRALYLLM